jgi:tetratricopeptide (TPR) repeat protein
LNYAGLGQFYLERNNHEKATEAFNNAVTVAASNKKFKDAEVYALMAMNMSTDGNLNDTTNLRICREKAIELGNKLPLVHYYLGRSYIEQNDGGPAVSAFERAFEMDKTMAKAQWQIGNVYYNAKNWESAKDALLSAITIDPEFAPAYKDLGDLSFQMKNTEKAVNYYKDYLAKIETNPKSQLKYASFLVMKKDFVAAYDEAIKVKNIDTTNVYLFRVLGKAAIETQKFSEGSASFETFFAKINPTKIQADDYHYYGKSLLAQGKDSLALIQYNKAMDMDSTKAIEINIQLADYFFKAKKFQESAKAYTTLISKKPKQSPNDFFNLGRCYYQLKEFSKADTSFMKVIELATTYMPAYLYRARCQSGLNPGNPEIAKPFYENYISKIESDEKNKEKFKKDLIEAYEYVGGFYYNTRDKVNAKLYFEKVKAIDPNNKTATDALNGISKMK